MIKSTNTKFSRSLLLLIFFALFCCLVACGGSKDEAAGTTTGSGQQIALTGSPTSLATGQNSILTATVTDSAGAAVIGATVSFELVTNNSTGTVVALNGGITDAGGQAVAFYTAGATNPGADVEDTVQASIAGATGVVIITRISSSDASTGLRMTLTADSTSLAAGQSTIVTATVTDGSGSPASGQAVTFALLNNNSGATLTILSLGVTDNSGQSLAIYAAGANSPTTSVQDTIQASVTGAEGVIMITRISNSAASTGLLMTLTADATSLKAGESTIIKATVTDGSGAPSAGQTVTFALLSNHSGATLVALNGGVTDASGQAIATYQAGANSPTTSVQDMIQASVTGTTGAVIITRSASSGGAATGLRITLTVAATSLAAGQTTIITATVTDGSGAVQGELVAFSFVTHPSGASLTILSATTDAAGEATALYTAGGTTPNATVQDVVQAGVTGTTKAVIITRTAGTGTGTTSNGTLALSTSSSVVAYGTPITITGTLRDADGALVPYAVVTFTAASSLVAYTPVSATALTNSNGVAAISLNAVSIDSSGATYISASAPITAGGTTTTITSNPLGIAVNGAAITLGTIALGSPTISTYGSSSVSVPVLINGVAATVPISVNFTSYCVGGGKATLSSPVTSNAATGTANSTYKDNLCSSGTDTITASVAGGASSSTTITVLAPVANNIEFVSATPKIIGTSTASAPTLSKSSIVKFKVVDASNNGIPGIPVTFSLLYSITPGGVTFTPTSATSDAGGFVTTSVTSGTVPTSVWIVATVTGSSPAIKTQSNMLTITTGLPTQNFFSLSVQTHNIEGWIYDGVETGITIIASDRVGNPVPNGTAINFITEGGQIIPASCTTGILADGTPNGTCSVTFKSAEFRPSNGRVTILAYAAGEESFLDTVTGNNSYDSGETFYDLGELYIDANESGTWQSGELFITPPSGSGTTACRTQPAGTPLPFNYGNVPNKQNTCNNEWGINYVRRSDVIVFSGSYGEISPTTVDMVSSCLGEFTLMLTDENGNPMPAGTNVTTKNNAVIWSGKGIITVSGIATPSIGGTPVIDTNALGGTSLSLKLDGGTGCAGSVAVGDTMNYPNGSLTIVTTTPKGVITEIPITVSGTQNIP